MKKLALGLVAGAVLWLDAGLVLAQTAVDIEAAEMEIIETDKLAVIRGDVIARREHEIIRAEEMVVTYVDVKQPDGTMKADVDTLVCKGNIRITTDTQVITGDRATFYVRRDELIVSGNVTVKQGQTVLRGPELSANLKTKHTVMKGGRVKGSFVPK